ncbi:MAG TPA: ROK family protein [Acidimicrobiales bacterium]|nr:ROK family protein [Acidimicrobiales bacterium]
MDESNVKLGIDIGGTGIKGAPVNIDTGDLTTERYRLLTPKPATPTAVAGIVGEVVKHFDYHGMIGCTFPAVVKHGVIETAANVDKSWIGTNARSIFEDATGCTFTVTNDADCAGVAEMKFGAGAGRPGVVIIVTLGTGIGTAVFYNGELIPNTELGHMELRGKDAERRAADSVRERKKLDWQQFAKRVDEYLDHLEAVLWPDLIIIGGGVSKKGEKFIPLLTPRCEVVAAKLQNEAGIVGAALTA